MDASGWIRATQDNMNGPGASSGLMTDRQAMRQETVHEWHAVPWLAMALWQAPSHIELAAAQTRCLATLRQTDPLLIWKGPLVRALVAPTLSRSPWPRPSTTWNVLITHWNDFCGEFRLARSTLTDALTMDPCVYALDTPHRLCCACSPGRRWLSGSRQEHEATTGAAR